jgi:hypothetical protein
VFLRGPALRQILPKLLIFGIIGFFPPEPLQSFDNFLLADLERIGDHTRGLFEAEASIAPSTAHFLKDKKIPIVFCH